MCTHSYLSEFLIDTMTSIKKIAIDLIEIIWIELRTKIWIIHFLCKHFMVFSSFQFCVVFISFKLTLSLSQFLCFNWIIVFFYVILYDFAINYMYRFIFFLTLLVKKFCSKFPYWINEINTPSKKKQNMKQKKAEMNRKQIPSLRSSFHTKKICTNLMASSSTHAFILNVHHSLIHNFWIVFFCFLVCFLLLSFTPRFAL